MIYIVSVKNEEVIVGKLNGESLDRMEIVHLDNTSEQKLIEVLADNFKSVDQ